MTSIDIDADLDLEGGLLLLSSPGSFDFLDGTASTNSFFGSFLPNSAKAEDDVCDRDGVL